MPLSAANWPINPNEPKILPGALPGSNFAFANNHRSILIECSPCMQNAAGFVNGSPAAFLLCKQQLLLCGHVGQNGLQILPGAFYGCNVYLLVRAVGVTDGGAY